MATAPTWSTGGPPAPPERSVSRLTAVPARLPTGAAPFSILTRGRLPTGVDRGQKVLVVLLLVAVWVAAGLLRGPRWPRRRPCAAPACRRSRW